MGVLCWQRTTMTWALFLIASFFLLGDQARGDDCADGWESIHRGCYRFTVDPQLGWEDALMDCQGRGGELISVSDMGEKGKLLKKVKALDKNRTWWVGLKRDKGTWNTWIDGGPFSYRVTRWKRGEPNNEGGKENCAEISSRGELNDKDCNSLRAFICEQHDITNRPSIPTMKPPTTEVPTTTTTTTTVPLTSERSESKTQLPSTAADVIRSTSRNDITPDSSTDDDNEDDEDVDGNEGQDDRKKGKVTARPLNPITEPPTTEVPTTTTTQQNSSTVPVTSVRSESKTLLPSTAADVIRSPEEAEEDLFEVYAKSGCFLLTLGQGRDKNRPFLYDPDATTCPLVNTLRATWNETKHNETQYAPCRGGKNHQMSFYCGGSPTCWRGEPNVDQCASPLFQGLLSMVSQQKNVTTEKAPEPEETVALTKDLANVTKSDEVTEADIAVTSKVLKSLVTSGAAKKVKDRKEVENIVVNVVKAGSNLLSANKTRVWKDMAEHDKIRSATSLLVAMETATVAMAGEIDVPTTIFTKGKNIELELRVINVTSSKVEADEEIVYSAEDSDTHFSIPLQTLSQLSKGGLAKVVFMTHYTVGAILDEDSHDDDTTKTDDGAEKKADDHQHITPQPKLASYILSASVGGSQKMMKLPEPISFTMSHLESMPEGFHSLCSFWSIAENGLGEWSQEGCRVARSNASQTTCECDHMTNFAVLMAVKEVKLSDLHMSMLRLVTIIGCIISCLCLLASWVTFTCFTTLQGERNSIHKNLVVCLFIAEMLFLTGINQTRDRLACGVVAGLLQYFFLAAFLWMMMEGVHIVLMLVQVFDASRSRMPYFYAGAYAPPVLIIAISAGLYHQGYGTENYCWLTTEKHFIWSFAGPVAVILFANSVILIYAMTMVCRHSEYVFTGKEKSTAGGISAWSCEFGTIEKTWIQGAMALEVLLGLTWIMGYFFLNQQSVAVAYVFTILNSTQGLFIFVFHCLLNKKARKEYRRVMKVKRRPSTTGSGSTQSASLGKNKFTSGSSFNRHTHSIDNPFHNYASHV
ncbi:adhesion G protein-coupled receptor L4-like isoform X1 [Littorina saxatilis]|uniref:adhesion G protein-coupled receptor L4-like isoform X1 n=1 Tax=Littorina saxatilis TaxID=31220 RepID=UPI0038B42E5E